MDAAKCKAEIEKYLGEIAGAAGVPSELKTDIAAIKVHKVEQIEVAATNQKVYLISIPYRIFNTRVRQNQPRIVAELEKKAKCHVVLYANRQILGKGFTNTSFTIRPRSRTLTAVHDAILEDIVSPSTVVGRRTLHKQDGSTLLKVHLDPKDKLKGDIGDKTESFAAAYFKLTNKKCVFMFPEHVY